MAPRSDLLSACSSAVSRRSHRTLSPSRHCRGTPLTNTTEIALLLCGAGCVEPSRGATLPDLPQDGGDLGPLFRSLPHGRLRYPLRGAAHRGRIRSAKVYAIHALSAPACSTQLWRGTRRSVGAQGAAGLSLGFAKGSRHPAAGSRRPGLRLRHVNRLPPARSPPPRARRRQACWSDGLPQWQCLPSMMIDRERPSIRSYDADRVQLRSGLLIRNNMPPTASTEVGC